MPDYYRYSLDNIGREVKYLWELGVQQFFYLQRSQKT